MVSISDEGLREDLGVIVKHYKEVFRRPINISSDETEEGRVRVTFQTEGKGILYHVLGAAHLAAAERGFRVQRGERSRKDRSRTVYLIKSDF